MAETDRDTWREARALFERVCELPPEDADAALADAPDDEVVLALARRLLVAERSRRVEQIAGAVQQLAPGLLREQAMEAALAGERLGPWRVEAKIGAGGMGTVFRARREDGGFDETVAIKFMGEGGTVARFDIEKRALARLAHPGIARILDAGTHEQWGPYLVMEHVEGEPIDAWCRTTRPGARACIGLLLEVIDAVSHAHAQLVLHRDLKPSNILVTATGRPVVLDLGLAKFLSSPVDAEGTALHAYTPRYASPEQLAREPLGVPSDIFPLAVILHELLTGSHPFLAPGEEDMGTLLQRVLSGRSIPLRRALARRGAATGCVRIDLSATALRDLEAVLEHALLRRAADSYQSADAFGDELRRVLADRPVHVRHSSRMARATRLARRHWPTATALALAVLSLLAGALLSWTYALEAQRQRDQAIASAQRAQQLAAVLTDAFSAPNPRRSRGAGLSAKDVIDQSSTRIATDPVLSGSPMLAAGLEAVLADTYRSIGALAESEALFERALERIRDVDANVDAVVDAGAPELRARLQGGLGWVRAYQSRWTESGELLAEAARGLEASGAHAPLVETLCRLATPLMSQQRMDEARAALTRGIALADRHGLPAAAGLNCATTLASSYLFEGRFDDAERHYLDVIARGSEDPRLGAQVGGAYSSLGGLRARQGRFPEAADHYARAASLLSAAVGADNAAVALARLGRAQALRGVGAIEDAGVEFAAATAAYIAWFGEDNDATAYARLLQAEFHYLLGEPGAATAALADAVDVLARTRGEQSTSTCRARAVQRGIAAAQGRPDATALDSVLHCLSAEDTPPLARALASVVAAENAPASAAALANAAAAVEALPFADPPLGRRLAVLTARTAPR